MSRRPPTCEPSALPIPARSLRGHAPLLRALGDEARLELVGRLAAAGGEACVCDLMSGLGLAQPTVSHHLKVLKDAGVVRSERRGSWVYYSLDLSILAAFGELIATLAPPRARETVDRAVAGASAEATGG